MNIESKSKWQIRLATLSIFLIGFVTGAVALNAYHLWFGGAKPQSRQEKFEEAFRQIGLNEAQKSEVQKIFGETREKVHKFRQEAEPRMQEIRTEADEKLQRVLTPEQWQRFQEQREKIKNDKDKDNPNAKKKDFNLK
jgi:Spy/CpxP family protein refolding chaperone